MRRHANDLSYKLLPTPLGECGLVWSEFGIAGLLLPESSPGDVEQRARRMGAEPAEAPRAIARIIKKLLEYSGGRNVSFDGELIDLSAVTEFSRAVYERTRRIPRGSTATYGEIARDIGKPKAARAVGGALGHNPIAIIVPCHRVVASAGPGGFSAVGGLELKARLLALEGAPQRMGVRSPAGARPASGTSPRS